MRNSAILRWTQNNKLHKSQNGSNNRGKSTWLHASENLTSGHIVYLVKFLGRADVDQPKGIEVVKQGIQKLHFGQEMKKSECSKLPKRELTISINGVAIQDPKSKEILHQYPLHRISYCADDKGEKKFFSFIAKDSVDRDTHSCFVFVSDKLAEEITLTIGQAFDLAYRQFMDTSGRDLENRKQRMMLQKRLAVMKAENDELRRRLKDISQLASSSAVQEYCRQRLIIDLLSVNTSGETGSDGSVIAGHNNGGSPGVTSTHCDTVDLISELDDVGPSVGTRLQGLLLSDINNTDSSDSGMETSGVGGHSPPSVSHVPSLVPLERSRECSSSSSSGRENMDNIMNQNNNQKDLFGAEPFSPHQSQNTNTPVYHQNNTNSSVSADPFGMGSFDTVRPDQIARDISDIDRRINEMKVGFSRGLTIGTDDFSLDDLDPLKN